MKKMNLFTALCLGLIINGCSSDDTKKSSSNTVTVTNKDLKDVTDYSSCSGEVPVGASYEGTWKASQASDNGLTTDLEITLKGNQATFRNTCAMGPAQAIAEIYTRTATTASNIKILDGGSKEKTSQVGDTKVTCSVNIPKMTFNYRLVGNCIELSVGNEAHKLVRQY